MLNEQVKATVLFPSADTYTKLVLTLIALSLILLLLRSGTGTVQAQTASPAVYIEPGTVAIRAADGGTQGEGKMVVDLRSGDIWGFPTNSAASPYPVDPSTNQYPVSKPVYLGRFDFSVMRVP